MKKKRINFDVSDEEHRQLKTLAAKEEKTIKELLLEALEKIFPDWRTKKIKTAVAGGANLQATA